MQYFQFYGYLSQQQNMMQDYIRTSTYQKAILSNVADFRDKVVLDVGAGSGFMVELFAQLVGPEGRVVAVDINAGLMERVAKSMQEKGISNVEIPISPVGNATHRSRCATLPAPRTSP